MISPLDMVLRTCLATALGAVVGMERERLDRAAGLRTHAMVALGAAVFMLASSFGFKDILGTPAVVLDPSRVAAQIVTGIGFLGAGAIIFHREMVRGLTTASSIWVVAAIGMGVGGGMYALSLVATGVALIVLIVLKRVENRWFKDNRSHFLGLKIEPSLTSIEEIRSWIEGQGLRVEQITVMPGEPGLGDHLNFRLFRGDAKKAVLLLDRLRDKPGVLEITFPGA